MSSRQSRESGTYISREDEADNPRRYSAKDSSKGQLPVGSMMSADLRGHEVVEDGKVRDQEVNKVEEMEERSIPGGRARGGHDG